MFDNEFTATGLTWDVLYPEAKLDTISAISATMVAFSYQQNIFPLYSELREKTTKEYQILSFRGLLLTGSIYWVVGTICCLMFGS